jgi:uncharacterized protein (DUF4213/DUF364 family)
MTTTYIDDVARELHEVCPDIDLTDPGIARAYALLVLAKGAATTSRNVHSAREAP